jgi:periplasmic divalent cation tolerance protein
MKRVIPRTRRKGFPGMDRSDYLVALTTVAAEEDAVRLARGLLDRRVAACVNIVPGVRSLYRWKGAIEDDREHLLVIKTSADRYPALSEAIEEIHPYEVPELLALPIEAGGKRYLSWLASSVSADSPERTG